MSPQTISMCLYIILDFTYCPLSRVLHVTLANWQRFGFEFHLRSSPSAFSRCEWSVDQPITSLLATPCCGRDPTRSKQLSTVVILGFQFGLYHVVVLLSFLRSISLASLFASLLVCPRAWLMLSTQNTVSFNSGLTFSFVRRSRLFRLLKFDRSSGTNCQTPLEETANTRGDGYFQLTQDEVKGRIKALL